MIIPKYQPAELDTTIVMTRRKLMRIIDRSRVKDAIQKAERRTSGQICVSVSLLFWGGVEGAANKAFARLGLARTTQRNAVLLFVVPSRRKIVVIGDVGIHEKVGQQFWSSMVAKVAARFKEGDFTGGLVGAVEEIGTELATYFPYDPALDLNELSDDVEIK